MHAFKIACWALIFIFRLRFPPGVSVATMLQIKSQIKNNKKANELICSKGKSILIITVHVYKIRVVEYTNILSTKLIMDS